ncbi:HAD family hydrolase [Chlorobium phaeovibrioides]|uniref:phosphoglycolate phosphatase n=1 Tax=Chlorobium phaeovibrioides TaxID=1094 RepID=A0A5M8IEJ0_CHLPH|nr:HAD family hydrolase [Chlorobium phaeovibrioides]KAA6232694.1 HAD family hydrolase [Chlorobium phaeovibrioides]
MSCKAVIFDMDGTLLDTLEDIATTLNTVLAAHGYPVHSIEACRYLVGSGMRELIRKALPKGEATPERTETLRGELLEAYGKHWNVLSHPYEGIADLLDGLEKRGIPKAILSNKADHFTKLCAEHLLEKWNFDVVMGHHEGIQHKPEPEGALLIAGQLGADPSEILYVGDTGIDMLTATRAGMYPAGVLWGFRPESELLEFGARSLARHPSELLELLEGCC